MFNLRNVHFYPLNELISNLMSATGLKFCTGKQTAKKARHFEKIQLGEHLATNSVNLHQACNIISYKRDF